MAFCFYSGTSIVSVSMLWNSNNTNSWATFVSEENHRHVVDCKSLQPSVWFVGCHWAPFVNQWLVKSQIYQSSADAIYTTWHGYCYLSDIQHGGYLSGVWCLMLSDLMSFLYILPNSYPTPSHLNKPQNGAWKGFIREYFVSNPSIIDICQNSILSFVTSMLRDLKC